MYHTFYYPFSFSDWGWYTYDVYENCPIFKTTYPLVHLRPKFFHPLVLGGPISNKTPFPNDNQSTKRKHNPRMTIICYQVFFLGLFQYQLINLVWLSFDFFSFSCSCTIYFFVALYSRVCNCPKIHEMSFIIIIHIFSTHFAISLFYLHKLKT